MITLIACLDMGSGIGTADGQLLFNIPKDMKRFRQLTSGKHVVMGRKTWDSLPKKPLEKRKNYVVTRDDSFSPDGAKVFNSIEEVVELGKAHDVFVIGGGEIYEQMMPHADRLMLTQVHEFNFQARVFFPDFSPKEWKIVKGSLQVHKEENQPSFAFATYVRKED